MNVLVIFKPRFAVFYFILLSPKPGVDSFRKGSCSNKAKNIIKEKHECSLQRKWNRKSSTHFSLQAVILKDPHVMSYHMFEGSVTNNKEK